MRRHMGLVATVATLFLGTASPATATVSAPAPVTGEVRANVTTEGNEVRGSVAMDANGNFVVTWGDHTPPKARLFNAAGAPLTGEIAVEQTPSETASEPSVAMAADGSFVVAWEDSDADNDGARARLFDASGHPPFDEIAVNLTAPGDQDEPSAAMDADGDFVVAWESCPSIDFPDGQDGDGCGVFFRLFTETGSGLTADIRVNQTTAGDQEDVAAAMDEAGNFVVAWSSSDCHVYARAYNTSGAPTSPEVQVSAGGDCNFSPAVSMEAASDFVVAWESEVYEPCCTENIVARRFQANGDPVGGQITVHAPVFDQQAADDAGVAVDAEGGFMVAWTGPEAAGMSEEVFARRIDAAGVPTSAEFRVNVTTADGQYGEDPQGTGVATNRYRDVAARTTGVDPLRFVFSWAGNGPGDDSGTFFRRYDDAGGAVDYQPDGKIKRLGHATFVGNDVYNTTGVGQSRTAQAPRLAKRTFVLTFQNDGDAADIFGIKGPATSTNFTVKYLQGATGSTNITAAVVAGTYETTAVPVGGARTIRVVITVRAGAPIGAIRNVLVTATSDGDGSKDAVKAVVKVIAA